MVAEPGFSPPRQCTLERIAKHVADVLVPPVMEETIENVRRISHERIQQRIVDKMADVLVPLIQEQIGEILKMILLELRQTLLINSVENIFSYAT